VDLKIDLRHAQLGDLEAVAELSRSSFTAAFAAENTPEDMASYLQQAFALDVMKVEFSDPNNSIILAENRKELAGYAKLRRDSKEPCINATRAIELERLYTAAELIGRGVGALLMQEAIRTARQEHYESLWLGVWDHNSGAIRFYQRQGFLDVGSHAFMLGEDRQIDRIMELSLV
jgi:ribosomal protein S18 acetylase RimI-like enzyme